MEVLFDVLVGTSKFRVCKYLDEWQVKVYEFDRENDDRTYHAIDREDVIDTLKEMVREEIDRHHEE